MSALQSFIDNFIQTNKVAVFSKTYCSHSQKAKNALGGMGVKFAVCELDLHEDGSHIQDILFLRTGARTVPRVFIKGEFIGGGSETEEICRSGKIIDLLGDD